MANPTDEELVDLYSSFGAIAVVGASSDPSKPSHNIPAYIQRQGFQVIPVSPKGGELFGVEVRASLADIDEKVDVVNVFRPPAEGPQVVGEAAAIGARVIWFQPGTDSDEAETAAVAAGLIYVGGICIGTTHGRLGLGPGP